MKPKRDYRSGYNNFDEPMGKYQFEIDTYDPSIYSKEDYIYHGTPIYKGKYPVLRAEKNRY
jgi:hypothetical protein